MLVTSLFQQDSTQQAQSTHYKTVFHPEFSIIQNEQLKVQTSTDNYGSSPMWYGERANIPKYSKYFPPCLSPNQLLQRLKKTEPTPPLPIRPESLMA
jgi:hypothetical protein